MIVRGAPLDTMKDVDVALQRGRNHDVVNDLATALEVRKQRCEKRLDSVRAERIPRGRNGVVGFRRFAQHPYGIWGDARQPLFQALADQVGLGELLRDDDADDSGRSLPIARDLGAPTAQSVVTSCGTPCDSKSEISSIVPRDCPFQKASALSARSAINMDL